MSDKTKKDSEQQIVDTEELTEGELLKVIGGEGGRGINKIGPRPRG